LTAACDDEVFNIQPVYKFSRQPPWKGELLVPKNVG
jgi:hypothetical protein